MYMDEWMDGWMDGKDFIKQILSTKPGSFSVLFSLLSKDIKRKG